MRASTFMLPLSGIVFMLGGCSGGSSLAHSAPSAPLAAFARAVDATPSPPAVRHPSRGRGWLSKRAASGQHLIYVANSDEVVIFSEKERHSPVGVITDGVTSAYGLFVDAQLSLYVCNQSENNVQVYPAGHIAPGFSYSSGLSRPLYAVADSTRLFVGNANNGFIVEYTLGNGQPQYTLETNGTEVDGITLDAAGNLYAAYRNSIESGIEYFAQGSGPGQNLGMTLEAPQGLVVDANDNIYVAETQGTNQIAGFHQGDTSPFAQTSLDADPTGLQLGAAQKHLYDSTRSGTVEKIAYPGLGSVTPWVKDKNVLDAVQGLALSPPAPL